MSIILVISLLLQLLFYVAVIGIGLFIQVKLSSNPNKYLGLILPVISFIFATLIALGFASFAVATVTMTDVVVTESVVEDESGEIIQEPEENIEEIGEIGEIVEVREIDSNVSGFLKLGFIFFVSNVPTIILGGIYVSERNKRTMRKEIEKMKINED